VERDDVISLQDYLVVLKRQRLLIVATVILVVVAALGVSFAQTPVYEAASEVVVEPVRRTQDVSLEDLWSQASGVETERLVVTSRPVAERAAEELGLEDPNQAREGVRVEPVRDTRVVRIIAADVDPAVAAEKANTFADAYLAHRRGEAMEGIVAARADLEQRAESLREELATLEEADEVDEVQRDALLAQLSAVVAQGAELGGSAGAVAGGGSVLAPAEVPESPVSPQPIRTGALALVLGLMLGVGLAFLRDHIDDVIRDESDFKRATGGLPILGRIPQWNDPDGGERLATILEPASLASESYRELSAGVRFLLLAHADAADPRDGDGREYPRREGAARAGSGQAGTVSDGGFSGRSVLISSAHAGDGKTSIAANLAVAAARVGLRTLLIDTDLRRPTVHRRFGLGQTTGLTDVLLSHGDLRDHVIAVGVDNLRVLPAGTIPPNPHELLASASMRALEREVVRRADLVIYDSPAVLAVPDALELGRQVDVAVLVGRAGATSRRQLSAAVERLGQVGTDVAGTVLNAIDSKTDGYYYSYYYEETAPADAPAGERERRGATSWRNRKADASGEQHGGARNGGRRGAAPGGGAVGSGSEFEPFEGGWSAEETLFEDR
jgi:polysaccharide biosynthesis transport protein